MPDDPNLRDTLERVRRERLALTVACPVCHRPIGEPCDITEPATPDVMPYTVHFARLEKANAAQ